MDDLKRLHLLRDLLIESRLSTSSSFGELANRVESILESIEEVPDALRLAYSNLWVALEVSGVQHQESGTEPTIAELADLGAMTDKLKKETDAEIVARGG